ncbi:hypothetical protein F4802DRAFT_613655 [Xylaria palmicola]|nr:hypothetical protein F4802DRAFT_613655 [Xylaria palmicola]
MNSGITKPVTSRSYWKPSKGWQDKLLEAGAGAHDGQPPFADRTIANSLGTEPRRSHREYSPAKGCLAQPATATATATATVQTAKRQLDVVTETDPLPAIKRARLIQADPHQPRIDAEAEKPNNGPIHQPKPKRPRASFLHDPTDPVRPCRVPDSLNAFVSDWIESIESDREKHCRSDTHLYYSDDDPVPRGFARSAPEMVRDADGFAVPPTPKSGTGPRSDQASDTGSIAPSDDTTPDSSRSYGKSLVKEPHYRDMNLAANNIYLRHPCDPIPEHITKLMNDVYQDRDSPGPSQAEVKQDRDLHDLTMGAGEPDVEKYFHAHIFPDPKSSDILKRSNRQQMARRAVPNTAGPETLRISTPVPDLLYGYNRHVAFPQQQSQLISMGTEMVATNQYNSLLYPFFSVEFKGEGGSMWVATNQCLGGSASCVSVAETLNRRLGQYERKETERQMSVDDAPTLTPGAANMSEPKPMESAAFSIAMSGTEARLYISWKHNEQDYYMANVKSFLLQDPDHYIEFRKYVRNIVSWGGGERLESIRDTLDHLREEGRKKASEGARSREPPWDSSAAKSKKQVRD